MPFLGSRSPYEVTNPRKGFRACGFRVSRGAVRVFKFDDSGIAPLRGTNFTYDGDVRVFWPMFGAHLRRHSLN